jgi:hypothetical protein
MSRDPTGYQQASSEGLIMPDQRFSRDALLHPGDLAVMRVTFFAGRNGERGFLGPGSNQARRICVSRVAPPAVIAFVRPA